jgi:hypothetical protein
LKRVEGPYFRHFGYWRYGKRKGFSDIYYWQKRLLRWSCGKKRYLSYVGRPIDLPIA